MEVTMRYYLLTLLLLINACSGQGQAISPAPDLHESDIKSADVVPGYIPWGFYDFEIARDGSSATVIPNRSVSGMWGYHMNVVKLLEVDPCTDCLNISNIHLLPNGDVSVDISIRHPYWDRRYTGFDVRGIIMFPATQSMPDETLREILDMDPYPGWWFRFANNDYGDAELMNPDGWTSAWAPEEGVIWNYHWYTKYMPVEYPIFQYFPGKLSSGEDLSTLSAFKRFHSTETRHMFEAGETVTRNYVIRPPETGPIKAGYAIYAHWYPPDNIPVIDPAEDFPPRANSPLPYEFTVTQDAPLDIDAPLDVTTDQVHWHIKTWNIDRSCWGAGVADFIDAGWTGMGLTPHPSGEPDDYRMVAEYFGYYQELPDAYPGTYRIICAMSVYHPDNPIKQIGEDIYIANFEYAAADGQW